MFTCLLQQNTLSQRISWANNPRASLFTTSPSVASDLIVVILGDANELKIIRYSVPMEWICFLQSHVNDT